MAFREVAREDDPAFSLELERLKINEAWIEET